MPQGTCLSHVAAGQHGAVLHLRAVLHDEVVGDDPVTDVYGTLPAAHQRTVLQSSRTLYLAAGSHVHVLDVARIDDGTAFGDASALAAHLGGIPRSEFLEATYQPGTVAVHGHHVCLVGGEVVVDGDLTSSCLVEDSYLSTVAEGGPAIHQDDIDILDEAVILDVVVGYVVLDVLYAAVVAHRDIVERGMVDARMLLYASRHLETLLKPADAAGAGEVHVLNVLEL